MTRSRHLPPRQVDLRERIGLAVIAVAALGALGFIGWLIVQLLLHRGAAR